MPKDQKENRKKSKSPKREKGKGRRPRHEDYVDSFRWGFVDEGDARNEHIPDEDLFIAEPSDNDFERFEASKVVVKKTKKSRAKSPPKKIAPAPLDEEDDDLLLPSYGRTPIPTDDELKHHLVDTPASRVPMPPIRPKREQMVWDPDKREYVPLIVPPVRERNSGFAPEKQPKKEKPKKTVEPPKKEAVPRREPEPRKEKPTKPVQQPVAKPKAEKKLPKPTPGPRGPTPKPQVPVPKREKVEKKPQSTPQPPKPPREEQTQREFRPIQRGGVQPHVESQRPHPADAESESTGFTDLGLSNIMLEALKVVRYLEPTPIQAGVFKLVQAGRDIMGQARTGTGKTAAFSIPILEGVEDCPSGNDPVALILVPTRELAVQVRDEATRLAFGRDIRITACYGGKPLAKQIARLKDGIDIVVGTPGRILDLMRRHALSLTQLRWVVLDEADRMLDIGFRPDIEKILKQTPPTRQTLLFSATLPPPVVRLAERYMREPEVLDFSNEAVAVETIDQYYVTVDPERKFDALVYLLNEQQPNQAIIFTRTKRGADRLARLLSNRVQNLAAIHGDLTQTDRDRVMSQFRSGKVKYLVATDVVGRGIDVTGISHIINYDIPTFCDDYVHRVGRTGRMGRDGVAFTFVTVQEGTELTRIEMRIDKLLKRAELKGFESFTKPTDPNATLDDITEPAIEPKPVYGKPVRKIRRAL